MATLSVGGSLVTTNDTLSNGVQDNITRLGTVASGAIGTGVTFPSGHVVNTWFKYATGGSQAVTNNSPTSINCAADIAVTAGNYLFCNYNIGGSGSSAGHWAGSFHFDGFDPGTWGHGITNGSVTQSGWHHRSGFCFFTIANTGTYSLELKIAVNTGTLTLRGDNSGTPEKYDGQRWVAQEIKA